MDYKGIKYSIYPDYNALQCEQYGDYDVEQVLRSTKFVELAGYIKPANFIVDRRNAEKPTDSFVSYLEKTAFVELQEYGVKRIFYVIHPDDIKSVSSKHMTFPSYVTLCSTLTEVFEIMDLENSK